MNQIKQQDEPMPFGKFKGKLICDLPNSYLIWLLDQEWMAKDYPNLYTQLKIENTYRNRFGVNV